MMPELRPEAIELVEKVKTFIKDEVKSKELIFILKIPNYLI